MENQALFYLKGNDGIVQCMLCPNRCILKEGMRGICDVRYAAGGTLKSLNYGEISSLAIDPIEKKPLYHYKPGSVILSAGSFGCNFHCGFCQNYSISKEKPDTRYIAPGDLVRLALHEKDNGNIGIAFTYNEPSIWYEYVLDTSILAKQNDLDIVLVTNGYINEEPLKKLLPYVDAVNIDLKAFNEEYYNKICGGDLKSVMETIALANEKCHVELTTLLVNGYNDTPFEVGNAAKWISSIDKNIPLHLSRYFPSYKFKTPPTPVENIMKCSNEARSYLNYVYTGNVNGVDSNTYCPSCGSILIKRNYYDTMSFIKENQCPDCGYPINVVL